MKFRPLTFLQTLFVVVIIGIAAVLIAREVLERSPRPASIASTPDAATASPSQCQLRLLEREGVRGRLLSPYETSRGCGYREGIELSAIGGVNFTRPVVLDCDLAQTLDRWVEKDVKPLAERTLGSKLVALEHLGGYNCRTIAGRRRLSEHSYGNAIDLSAVRLADGRRIKLLGNWEVGQSTPAAVSEFWKQVARKACRRFHVVLTPAYNAAHADHFHFDNGPFRSCRT